MSGVHLRKAGSQAEGRSRSHEGRNKSQPTRNKGLSSKGRGQSRKEGSPDETLLRSSGDHDKNQSRTNESQN
jgi:hypothetical protein